MQFSIESLGSEIAVETDEKWLVDYFKNSMFPSAHIPEFKFLARSKNPFAIIKCSLGAKKFQIDGNNVVYTGNRTSLYPNNLVFLMLTMLEANFEKSGIYAMHSAAVSKNGRGLIITGELGAGKTSLALTLSRKGNYNFISNERTAINQSMEIVGGTKCITVDEHVLKKVLGKGSKNFQSDANSKRTIIDAKNINGFSLTNRAKIKLMTYIHLDDGLKEPVIYKWPKWKVKCEFYEELTSLIRGSVCITHNFTNGMPSLDKEELVKKRIAFLERLSKSVDLYYIRGSLEQAENFLSKKFGR